MLCFGKCLLLFVLVAVLQSATLFVRALTLEAKDIYRTQKIVFPNQMSQSLSFEELHSLHTKEMARIEKAHNDFVGGKAPLHTFFLHYHEDCSHGCHEKVKSEIQKMFPKKTDVGYKLWEENLASVRTNYENAIKIHNHIKSLPFSDSMKTKTKMGTEMDSTVMKIENANMLQSMHPIISESKISRRLAATCQRYNHHKETKIKSGHKLENRSMTLVIKFAKLESESENRAFLLSLRQTVDAFQNSLNQNYASPESRPLVEIDTQDFLIASKYDLGAKRIAIHVYKDTNCLESDRLSIELGHLSSVLQIDPRGEPVIQNRWAKPVCQSGVYTSQPITVTEGIDGNGTVVGVMDTGLDMSSCYFNDPDEAPPYCPTSTPTISPTHRTVTTYIMGQDDTDDSGGHGTHVAGSVSGNSSSPYQYGDFIKYNGMAYNSKVAFYDIGDTSAGEGVISTPSDLVVAFGLLRTAGARIITNSWGTTGQDHYTADCEEVDEFMHTNADTLVLFAAGNSGDDGEKTITSPSGAKNCLTVGATLNSQRVFTAYETSVPDGVTGVFSPSYLAYFSSRGPASGYRIKPDVVAPGWWTVSANAKAGQSSVQAGYTEHCTVDALQGTSMATPTAAGNVAIIRNYFTARYYPFGSAGSGVYRLPRGDLMKAMMIQSGQALTGVTKVDPSSGATSNPAFTTQSSDTGTLADGTTLYPSNDFGYGRILLSDILDFSADTNIIPNVPLRMYAIGFNGEETSLAQPGNSDSTPEFDASSATDSTSLKFYFKSGTDTSKDIKITLVWTDEPCTANTCSGATQDVMINKLKLEVFSCTTDGTIAGTGTTATWSSVPSTCTNQVNTASNTYPKDATGSTPNIYDPVVQVILSGTTAVLASKYYMVQVTPVVNTAVGTSTSAAPLSSNQAFSLVMTQDVTPLAAGTNPWAVYTSSKTNISEISTGAKAIISVFTIIAFILLVFVIFIYYSHKIADAKDEEDLDREAAAQAEIQRQRHHKATSGGHLSVEPN
jgi:uncharacterized membrane protein